MEEESIKCPRCFSTQIHADKKGFSTGKAIAGTIVGGVLVGAAVGSVGKNKIILTCLKCGHTFKIGESCSNEVAEEVEHNEVTTYKCSRCDKISTVSASYCPKCGNRFSQADIFIEPKGKTKTLFVIMAIIAVIVLIIIAL